MLWFSSFALCYDDTWWTLLLSRFGENSEWKERNYLVRPKGQNATMSNASARGAKGFFANVTNVRRVTMVLSDACVCGLCPSCIQDAHVIPASRKRRQVETRVRQRFASNTCYIGRVENKLYASKPLCEVRADVTLGCRGLPLLCIFYRGEPLAGSLSECAFLHEKHFIYYTLPYREKILFPFYVRASRVLTQL